jgi:hypothetical protein
LTVSKNNISIITKLWLYVDEANGGYLYQTCWDGNKERGDTFFVFHNHFFVEKFLLVACRETEIISFRNHSNWVLYVGYQ